MKPATGPVRWGLRIAVASAVVAFCAVALAQRPNLADELLARMEGSWGTALSAAELEELAAAREALAANPDDAQAQRTVLLYEDVMAETTAVVEGRTLRGMSGGRVIDETPVTVAGTLGDILMLDSDEGRFYVRFDSDGTMVVTYEDHGIIQRWRRTDGRTFPPLVAGGPGPVASALQQRRFEARSLVLALKTAEMAYHAEAGSFLSVDSCPPESVKIGPIAVPWQDDWPCHAQLETLGWFPEGTPRCRYRVDVTEEGFRATGECDLDGDGEPAQWEITKDTLPERTSASDVF